MPSREAAAAGKYELGKLGELLVGLRQIAPEQIDSALERQHQAGGRLGTCLLESSAIEERALLAALSLQTRHPLVDHDELRRIDPRVIARVPGRLATRLGAIPFREEGQQLFVAMLEPDDLAAIDDLSFAATRRIVPHIGLELRIREALDRHYHEAAPERLRKLWDQIHRRRFMWGGETPEEAPTKEPENTTSGDRSGW